MGGLKKHKGAQSELTACVWLINEGYEVYRNVSAFGSVDIIATRGDEILKIDVKSCVSRLFKPKLTDEQIGVIALYVYPDGTCELDANSERIESQKSKWERLDGIERQRGWRSENETEMQETLAAQGEIGADEGNL